jgi:hypothetical protein
MQSATSAQLRALGRFGLDIHRDLTKGEANHLLEECHRLDEQYPTPATPQQEYALRRRGRWRTGLSKQMATRLIAGMMSGVKYRPYPRR